MTTQRRTPSIRVEDVAGLMANTDTCPHRVWHAGRHSSPLRTGQPIEAEPAQASVVRRMAAHLEGPGIEVYPSLRNGSRPSGRGAAHASRAGPTSSPVTRTARSRCTTSATVSRPLRTSCASS